MGGLYCFVAGLRLLLFFLERAADNLYLYLVVASDKAGRVEAEVVTEVDDILVGILNGCYGYQYHLVPVGMSGFVIGFCHVAVVLEPLLALVVAVYDEAGNVAVFIAVVDAVVGGVV